MLFSPAPRVLFSTTTDAREMCAAETTIGDVSPVVSPSPYGLPHLVMKIKTVTCVRPSGPERFGAKLPEGSGELGGPRRGREADSHQGSADSGHGSGRRKTGTYLGTTSGQARASFARGETIWRRRMSIEPRSRPRQRPGSGLYIVVVVRRATSSRSGSAPLGALPARRRRGPPRARSWRIRPRIACGGEASRVLSPGLRFR